MMFSAGQAPFTISASLLMALQPLLLTLSKGDDGYFAYSVLSATMLCELLKLVFSGGSLIVLLIRRPDMRSKTIGERPLLEFLQFLVPSLIYFANNNLAFVILQVAAAMPVAPLSPRALIISGPAGSRVGILARVSITRPTPAAPQSLDPTSYQLISQTKTVFTGVLFRALLKRRLTIFQWTALFFLGCGTACSQLPTSSADGSKSSLASLLADGSSPVSFAASENKTPIPSSVGVILSLVTALFSSVAGVYNEKLLKARVVAPIHWQNTQMYLHGLWLNATFMMIYDGSKISETGLLHGYTGWAWAAVVTNAFVGLAVSAVLKFCDNIARVYAHAISMIIVLVVSVPLFGQTLSAQIVLALFLVLGSTVQYNVPKMFADNFDPIDEPVPGESTRLASNKA